MDRTLVTSALPYGNGPLHFGHLAGVYLPSDIYVKHMKLKGERCLHICGSDEHGVAIMLNAQKSKQDYESYVDEWHEVHKKVFASYGIGFDFFGQTSKPYHYEEVQKWFKVLDEKGMIEKKVEQQLQCQSCHNFLPDRFVEGQCYECGYEKARGDECPQCGTWIDPVKLKSPVCQFCESTDIEVKDSQQWYLMLTKYEKEFKEWLSTKSHWKKTVYPYLESLVKEGMVDRAITRDLDWGVPVPREDADGKRLYVWFDAPIGYVSNTKELFERTNSSDDYLSDWWQNKNTKLVHFIGKDNIIFHGLIFPIMSMSSGLAKAVDELPANQYVNLFGRQFSKSQGWYIDAQEAVDEFGETALRYALIGLIPEQTDSSFTWSGFGVRVNNELANNVGNLVSRCFKFIQKNFAEGVPTNLVPDFEKESLWNAFVSARENSLNHLDKFEFKKGMESVMRFASEVNLFFTEKEPWKLIKSDQDEGAKVLAITAQATFCLGALLAPYLPTLSKQICELGDLGEGWASNLYRTGQWVKPAGLEQGVLKVASPGAGLVPKIDEKKLAEREKSFNE